ncbi:hypothetical protein ABZ490_31995 [Streptomyces sp. NPDC005811]|uniref:hypothetical protein n=1 Tax=Streptomyces sp. NPDC005811 TaxID=3154565 RepID=UPI0033FE8ECF
MVRRPLALIVALVLFAEGFGIALLNWALGIMADSQNMSLAGIDPDVMSRSSKVGGIVFGLYFAACGLVALLVAVRNRAPSLLGRILLISAAVTHGVLGAVAWGLLGRTQFAFMVVVLGLIVLLLMTYDARPGPAAEAPGDGEPGEGGPTSLEKGEDGKESGEESEEGDGSAVTPPAAPTAQ